MIGRRRTIFRAVAFEQYVRGRDRIVLPRHVRPGTLRYLWALLGLLLGGTLLAAMTPIPEYAWGTAVILERAGADDGAITVAMLVPAEYAARVQVGQAATLRTERGRIMAATVAELSTDARQHASAPLRAQVQVGTRPAWALLTPSARTIQE